MKSEPTNNRTQQEHFSLMSATVKSTSTPMERLSALEDTWNIDSNQQIKLSSRGQYVLQTKPTDFFSWGKQLILRWRNPEERESFRAANKQLQQDIQAVYGEAAGKSFQAEFALRITSGQPISTGRVKAFFEKENLPSVYVREAQEQKASANYKRLFSHGTVEKKPASDLSEAFCSPLSSASETKTILSPDVKRLSEMGYMIDPDRNPDMLIPSGCVQILGSDARAKLLEQALYEPTARKQEIKKLQSQRAQTYEEVSTRLSMLRESLAFFDIPQVRAEIGGEIQNSEIQSAHAAKQSAILADVDFWSPKQLAAYAQMHALVEDAREAPVKKSTEIRKLEEDLKKSRSQLDDSSLPLEKIDELSKEISKLTTDIEAARKELARLTPYRSDILSKSAKAGGWESWSPEQMLQFVHQNRMDPISFDRIKLKVNGKFLDCRDMRANKAVPFNENFEIFKKALQELNPDLPVTEDHFRELISLCDRNKTTAGAPSGVYHDENDLPSFGQAASLIPTEINCYEITLSPDQKSFDFHFDSNRSLLNSITLSGGVSSNVNLTPNFLYTTDVVSVAKETASLPRNFPLLERRCLFTWRYTPVADSRGGNMGFGNLDLLDSRQGYWPLERKHQAALDARTQPFVDGACIDFERTINSKSTLGDLAEQSHVWPGLIPTRPSVSEAFYKDLSSGSDKRGVCFLKGDEGTLTRLYQRNPSLLEEQSDEPQIAAACQQFVDFVGNKDQAFAISQYATQHFSPQILIHQLGKAGVLVLPPHGQGELLGPMNYSFTFSKSEKGETVMQVSCQQQPTTFNGESTAPGLTKESYLNLNYNITFHFEKQNPRPLLKVSDIKYNYSLEEEPPTPAAVPA